MKVHLIHGLHSSQPGGTVAKLDPFLKEAGFETIVHNYGYASALTARFINPFRAIWLATSISDGDILVGHSNGCTLAWMINRYYKTNLGLVLINAALDDDAIFPGSRWVNVYFNKGDEIVPLSEIFVAHPWGAMGHDGYTGVDDDEVMNVDCGNTPGLPVVDGHSDLFSDDKIGPWAHRIIEDIKKREK